jgi:hypothetical protein
VLGVSVQPPYPAADGAHLLARDVLVGKGRIAFQRKGEGGEKHLHLLQPKVCLL